MLCVVSFVGKTFAKKLRKLEGGGSAADALEEGLLALRTALIQAVEGCTSSEALSALKMATEEETEFHVKYPAELESIAALQKDRVVKEIADAATSWKGVIASASAVGHKLLKAVKATKFP